MPSKISAPVLRTLSGIIALTVAAVPTGMKAGVRISPRGVEITPARALPSVACRSKEKLIDRAYARRRKKKSPPVEPVAMKSLSEHLRGSRKLPSKFTSPKAVVSGPDPRSDPLATVSPSIVKVDALTAPAKKQAAKKE